MQFLCSVAHVYPFFIGDLHYILSGRVYLEKIWNFELVAWDVITVSEMADERVKLEHS